MEAGDGPICVPLTLKPDPSPSHTPPVCGLTLPLDPLSFVGGVLPIGLFYKIWLYDLRFGHEDIETFARREALCEQHLQGLHFVCSIMLENSDFIDFICLLKWKAEFINDRNPETRGQFYLLGKGCFAISVGDICISNPFLCLKMVAHIITLTVKSKGEKQGRRVLSGLLKGFRVNI